MSLRLTPQAELGMGKINSTLVIAARIMLLCVSALEYFSLRECDSSIMPHNVCIMRHYGSSNHYYSDGDGKDETSWDGNDFGL